MSAALDILDMAAEIAALPRRTDAEALPHRTRHEWITFHYSAVVYQDRRPAAERARVLDEARHHLAKNWAKAARPGEPPPPPVYADCYMYDWVVLSDGVCVRTRDVRDPRQLYHCGNSLGNTASLSVHVMLGGQQDLTQPQRQALFALFDQLRAEHHIPRERVVAHCEWPKAARAAVPMPTYRQQIGQSACPGPVLFRHVAAYRELAGPTVGHRYVARAACWVRDAAMDGAHSGDLTAGQAVQVVAIVPGDTLTRPGYGTSNIWAELATGGYVWLPQLKRVP